MKRWVLATPVEGAPRAENFRLVEEALRDPHPGEIEVRLAYHTVAPGVRAKLARETYVARVMPGESIPGMGVGVVATSNHPCFAPGDLVSGELGWATHAIIRADKVRRLDWRHYQSTPIRSALGVLGPAGLTAYFGLKRVARIEAGETVLVSSAAGAVGAAAGQMARVLGCDTVGIAGSDDKRRELIEIFGFNAAINYREEPDLDAAIRRACPGGVDVYFDNVGGAVTDAAIRAMATNGRIVVCGQTSEYSAGEPRGWRETTAIVSKRLRIEGFILFDFAAEFDVAAAEIGAWLAAGAIVDRPTIVDGVEHAAEAFISIFGDRPPGRLLVRTDPAAC